MTDWCDILRIYGIDVPELETYQTERDNTKTTQILILADDAIDALVTELARMNSGWRRRNISTKDMPYLFLWQRRS